MKTIVADHPLISCAMTQLRDERTTMTDFRRLCHDIVTLLAPQATVHLPWKPTTVSTPVAEAVGAQLTGPPPMLVPVMRAGLGLLEPLTRLLPAAEVGFVGLARDEKTLHPNTYANRLPADLSGRYVFALDPMLATGGTLVTTINDLLARGAKHVTAICLLAAPEGLATVAQAVGDRPVQVVVAALDERLNDNGYIVPGLGDAGDRLYGPAH